MEVQREQGRLAVELNRFEAPLLRRCLTRLAEHYTLPPAELDDAGAEAWYSTRSCSPEETRAWVESLHELKRAQLTPIHEWITQLAQASPQGATLYLPEGSLDSFLSAINDYRLLQAARHHVGEAEMELHLDRDADELTPALRVALLEIHFLAWLIEELLRAMNSR